MIESEQTIKSGQVWQHQMFADTKLIILNINDVKGWGVRDWNAIYRVEPLWNYATPTTIKINISVSALRAFYFLKREVD